MVAAQGQGCGAAREGFTPEGESYMERVCCRLRGGDVVVVGFLVLSQGVIQESRLRGGSQLGT